MTNLEINKCYVGLDEVDKVYLGENEIYEASGQSHDYSAMPLTFEILSGGDIVWVETLSAEQPITIEYSKNGGPWTQITSASGSAAPVISVVSGDTVRFRGDNLIYYGYKQVGISQIPYKSDFSRSTCTYDLYGNIMSIIDSTGFTQITSIPSGMGITNFFAYQGPVDASDLVLPATTLADGCYDSMFYDCTSLTAAPALPATTLSDGCYSDMFYGCTSLTTAPVLPATTLADGCYQSMFGECTSLTTAPVLPATTLVDGCYGSMFEGCTSLTAAPELPATTLAEGCYQSMFYGCTSLTAAPALPATTLADYCYSNMFYDCTSLTTAPVLPATTLTNSCYGSMFYDCTSLNTITCLATNPDVNYTSVWTENVAPTGTFYKAAGVTWDDTGIDGIPLNWTVLDAVV